MQQKNLCILFFSYKLSQDADREQGKGNALMMLPPTVSSTDVLNVEVLDVVVRQMWMVILLFECAYLNLNVSDCRMKSGRRCMSTAT